MLQAFLVGLNPLANSGKTIENLDSFNVDYVPYTWDNIKSGKISMELAAREIADKIKSLNPSAPVIVSVCGDSVLHLPSSAGTGTIGYQAADVYRFLSIISASCNVSCVTVAELKTSLSPSAAPLVGEFLTQCLFVFHSAISSAHKKK